MIDVVEIQKILPHRFPFLLLDRVTELVPQVSIEGYKNVGSSMSIQTDKYSYLNFY